MMRSQSFGHGATRGRLGRGRVGGAALLVLGAVWTACALDERPVDVAGAGSGGTQGIGNLLEQGGSGGGGGAASILVEPSALDLGPVVVGSPVRARLRIENDGDAALGAPSVALASGSPAFSLLQNSCDAALLPGQKLASGQSCEVRLQLLALSPGDVSGQIAIDVAESLRNVPLAAVGNAAGELILAPAAGSSDNFGSVRLGTSAQFVFNLTNPGIAASGPLSLHLFNTDVTQVTGAPGACVSGETSLDAGQTCDVHLAFGPTRRGPTDALLVVTTDAAGSVGLPLSGRGVVAGALGVSHPNLDFDGVVLGDAGARALRVTNDGDEPLTLVGVTLAGAQASEFSIQSSDCTGGRMLVAGAGCDVITEFRPRTTGDGKSAALTLSVSGGASQLVELVGSGLDQGSLAVGPAAGSTVDFGAIALGEERIQVFQVSNGSAQTSGPLAISASGDFALVPASQPGDCENAQTSLDNGASCTLTVKLAPARRAAQYGSLSIRSPLAKSASLRLSGTGMAPPRLTIAQDEVNFGRVLTGGTYQASVTVLNQGDQELPPLVATLQDPSGASPSGFAVENGCTSPIGFQASCVVNVRFQPTAPGFPVSLLRVEGVAGGAASTLLYGQVSQAGTLVLAATEGESAEFGEVGTQTTKTVNFTLSNPSSTPSGRLSITASSPLFTIDTGTCNPVGSPGLANGESCTFSVTYRPTLPAAVDATLSIQSPGAGGTALSLSGQGRSPANLVAEGNRDFATANIGQAEPTDPRNDSTWSLRNDGDLATGTLQISNSNPTDFAVVTDGCEGQSLLGHTSCEIAIRFRPTATDARSGDLVVLDATSSQSVTLKMTGNGVQIAQPGESCVNADCATGECTGGKCCDRACVGGCQVCGSDGVCIDQDGREQCGDGSGVCFGVDRCALPEGLACSGDAQCGSNNCERRLGGASANDRVCCVQNCAAGDQCSPDGLRCQAPTLTEGTACGGAGQLACGSGLECKECLQGGRQCTPPDECCGGCDGDQVCDDGSCGCPGGTVDCEDGRCILDRAGACCDSNGCAGSKTCSASSDLCGCPATAPRDCGGNVCIPSSQCCNCGGPCQTCNTTTGTCGQVANGQPGQCGSGLVCSNGNCAPPAPVGLGQRCNQQANNCAVGSCVQGTCSCSGTNPNACNGNRCVNFQTDVTNCGACGIACGALGCSAGRCNCPAGQTFVNGLGCRLPDGASCTPGGVACASGPCNSWLSDCDRDGFGEADPSPIRRCGAEPPPGTPSCTGGRFELPKAVNDCCDTEARAFPGQTLRIAEALPAECVSGAATHDWNCNGRNDGAPYRDCNTRTTAAACAAVAGNGATGQAVGSIVVGPHPANPPAAVEGAILCGNSVTPGGCAFFTTTPNTSFSGETGCQIADGFGFTQLPCN